MLSASPRTLAPVSLLGLLLLASCGGGGGGGGGSSSSTTFRLLRVEYGRALDGTVVSPLTTVARDPRTGLERAATLTTLDPGVDVQDLIDIELSASFAPPVIPRNAVLVLTFSADVDPASVFPDALLDDDHIDSPGSISVRRDDGRGVPVTLTVTGRQVWLDARTEGRIGFPPSPVIIGEDGNAIADARGSLRLTLPIDDSIALRSTAGDGLVARNDLLGLPKFPIGLNPGNDQLDFIEAGALLPFNDRFAGFLPDDDAPRIVRDYVVEAALDFAAGDSFGNASLLDADATFDTLANDGAGEWAGATLILRPGRPGEERRTVTSNSATLVALETNYRVPPRDGDAYQLTRVELFEPRNDEPVDDAEYDPANPQNLANTRLSSFLEAYELSATGEAVGDALDIGDPLPAFCELRIRFSEPMSDTSFHPWETLRVTLDPDPGPDEEKLTRIVLSEDGRVARIQPVRDDDEGLEVVGWGPDVQSLQVELTTLPHLAFLQERVNQRILGDLLAEGTRGVTDLAGRTLGFPPSALDLDEPVIRYRDTFSTDEAISRLQTPPESRDWGVIVHRFKGIPEVVVDPDTGRSGQQFRDRDNVYWPAPDINATAGGRLSGRPPSTATVLHDADNQPPDGSLDAFPFGSTTPLISFWSDNSRAHTGARMQHVYRDVDCQVGADLAGSEFDLYRVSWAPIGGNVNTDTYENISIHAGHTHFRPITTNNGLVATFPGFGLSEAFDYDTFERIWIDGDTTRCPGSLLVEGPNHYPGEYQTCVPVGTSYKIAPRNLFTPAGSSFAYHPWPEFEEAFAYNNGGRVDEGDVIRDDFNTRAGQNIWEDRRAADEGDSLLLEYRIRPQDTNVSGANGFTLALGIQVTPFPNFRVFSRGEPGALLFPDARETDIRSRCAVANTGLGAQQSGDNSRYFAAFDYIKRRSTIFSPWVRARAQLGSTANFAPPLVWPPLSDIPAGTRISLAWAGADDPSGANATDYGTRTDRADGRDYLGMRVTMTNDVDAGVSPSLDTVAVPFLRE